MQYKDKLLAATVRIAAALVERPMTRLVPILLFVLTVYIWSGGLGLRAGLGGVNAQEWRNDPVVNGPPAHAPAGNRPGSFPPPAPAPALESPQLNCPQFINYFKVKHAPFSTGAYNLSFQRPMPVECRRFRSREVDETVARFKDLISDPDLYRLFENAFPNTLDTAVKFKGYATDAAGAETDEELTFVITGDINAMWLRDSANQMQSYLPLLRADAGADSLASLYRGVINLQARYILDAPYCNSFQAPDEAKLRHVNNMYSDRVKPAYDPLKIWECKYELDSLAAFLQISTNYIDKTGDYDFFGKYKWVDTVKMIMQTAEDMQTATRGDDGRILDQPYTFTRASRWGDTLINGGKGSPVRGGTGLIRSAFRPSDDACIYQLFIPANMMFSRYLQSATGIAQRIGEDELAKNMQSMAANVRAAIEDWGVTQDREYGKVYAYEIDGFGSINMMDDANIPSLLSAPFFGYLNVSDETYQNTRKKLLSKQSAYYSRGPVLNAMGGPHDGPGKAWPMARIVGILTTDDDDEIEEALGELVSSTAGLGLIHESINSFDQEKWTRQWFSWANGLFGQMILDLEQRKPEMLEKCFQPDCLGK